MNRFYDLCMEISSSGAVVAKTIDWKIRRHSLEWTGASGYTSPIVCESMLGLLLTGSKYVLGYERIGFSL